MIQDINNLDEDVAELAKRIHGMPEGTEDVLGGVRVIVDGGDESGRLCGFAEYGDSCAESRIYINAGGSMEMLQLMLVHEYSHICQQFIDGYVDPLIRKVCPVFETTDSMGGELAYLLDGYEMQSRLDEMKWCVRHGLTPTQAVERILTTTSGYNDIPTPLRAAMMDFFHAIFGCGSKHAVSNFSIKRSFEISKMFNEKVAEEFDDLETKFFFESLKKMIDSPIALPEDGSRQRYKISQNDERYRINHDDYSFEVRQNDNGIPVFTNLSGCFEDDTISRIIRDFTDCEQAMLA